MEVLVIDGGGRGEALGRKIAESPLVDAVFMSPGGPGADEIGESTGIERTNIDEQVRFIEKQKKIGLVVVSADDPLALSAVDRIEAAVGERGVRVWGPSAAAYQIESSKLYAKQIMTAKGVPTAEYDVVYRSNDPLSYQLQQQFPLFAKMDGLFGGKGVRRTEDMEQLRRELVDYQSLGRLDSDHPVVVEAGLSGMEGSLQAFCDGTNYRMVPFVMKDYKTIHDGDTGPMTGGMSVVGPVPGFTAEDIDLFGERYVAPVIEELAARGRPFKGMLYPGLRGWKVLEYNGRPGDAEAQVWAALLESDIVEVMLACCEGRLAELPPLQWRNASAACIVLAAKGYPTATKLGAEITGHEGPFPAGVQVLQAGTKKLGDRTVVDAGRALNVISVGNKGDSLRSVIDKGYEAAAQIHFEGKQMRTDVGDDVCSNETADYIAQSRANNWR